MPEPVELIPGSLAMSGYDILRGPTISVFVKQRNKGDVRRKIHATQNPCRVHSLPSFDDACVCCAQAYAFTINLEATLNIGSGDSALPRLYLDGTISSSGQVDLIVTTKSAWQPLAGMIPDLSVPELAGRVRLHTDGSVVASIGGSTYKRGRSLVGVNEAVNEISFGEMITLKNWQVIAELSAKPCEKAGGRRLQVELPNDGSSAALLALKMAELAENATAEELTSGLTAATVDAKARSQVGRETRLAALRRLRRVDKSQGKNQDGCSGYSFLVNASGGITIGSGANAMSFFIAGILSPQSIDVRIDHAGGWKPLQALGIEFETPRIVGGLRIGHLPDTDVVGEAYIDAWAFVTLTRPLELIPNLLTLSALSVAPGRQLVDAQDLTGPTFGVQLKQQEKGSSPSFALIFRGDACIEVTKEMCLSMEVAATFGNGAFQTLAISGAYTGGDLKPLGFLPEPLDDVVVVQANSETPLYLKMSYSKARACKLELGFAATMSFKKPDLLGGGTLDIPVVINGCPVGADKYLILHATIPTIKLPGDLEFSGLEVVVSTSPKAMEYNLRPLGESLRRGRRAEEELVVELGAQGVNLFWEGPSPLPDICEQDVLIQFAVSKSEASFAFVCKDFVLTLLEDADVKSLNFLRFESIDVRAAINTGAVEFAFGADFMLATGDSTCENPKVEQECLTSRVQVTIAAEKSPPSISFSLELAASGVWVEPLGLRNFAIAYPSFGLGVSIIPSPPYAIPKLISWGITIYYKPDPKNDRDKWPAELFAPKATSEIDADGNEVWTEVGRPDLSKYTTSSLREISTFFLYEKWSSSIDDPLLSLLPGIPRFAMKLNIPKLTLIDVLMMFSDMALSITGQGDTPTPFPESLNDFVKIDMSVVAELSLIESDGVPEWQGEPGKSQGTNPCLHSLPICALLLHSLDFGSRLLPSSTWYLLQHDHKR